MQHEEENICNVFLQVKSQNHQQIITCLSLNLSTNSEKHLKVETALNSLSFFMRLNNWICDFQSRSTMCRVSRDPKSTEKKLVSADTDSWLRVLGLIHDPGGHLQSNITLTCGQSKRIKYFTPSCLFYKAFLSPQWFQLGSSTVFCDAFKRGNKLKGRWGGDHVSLAFRAFVVEKKRPRGSGRSRVRLVPCLLCFVLFLCTCLVFLISSFLSRSRITLPTVHALCSEGSDSQDTRADLCYVLWRSDPNEHLVNIWCCLTGMTGLHNSTAM